MATTDVNAEESVDRNRSSRVQDNDVCGSEISTAHHTVRPKMFTRSSCVGSLADTKTSKIQKFLMCAACLSSIASAMQPRTGKHKQ